MLSFHFLHQDDSGNGLGCVIHGCYVKMKLRVIGINNFLSTWRGEIRLLKSQFWPAMPEMLENIF